jgi:hypothetical protein
VQCMCGGGERERERVIERFVKVMYAVMGVSGECITGTHPSNTIKQNNKTEGIQNADLLTSITGGGRVAIVSVNLKSFVRVS